MKKILITGGAGFIGSHVIRTFVNKYTNYHIYNLDILSYSGNLENLKDIEDKENYTFLHGDISDFEFVSFIFQKYKFDSVINLAAESHVDRSISDPLLFAKTNILGTVSLLNSFKKLWEENWKNKLFYHISTDEVFGSLGKYGFFKETSSYSPNSPYAASKASSDHFVRSFAETYKMPYIISNSSNNYGPNQFPEKLIPLTINNIINNLPVQIYGDGGNIRDWLYVKDHALAIDTIFHKGQINNTYVIGASNEWSNIEMVKLICEKMDFKLGLKRGESEKLIKFVNDRPGHDLRYAIDTSKIENELNWSPSFSFEKGVCETIDWYISNKKWLERIKSGEYKNYKIRS